MTMARTKSTTATKSEIVGGPHIPDVLEQAIDEQRSKIFNAQAMIEATAIALNHSLPDTGPCFDRVLNVAAQLLGDIAGDLEGVTLESRAAEMERQNEART
jgi:hypothetical protein